MSENRKNTAYRFQIRILIVYCLLLLLSFSGSILAIRRFLLLRLDIRVEQALNQEVQEFRILVSGKDPETAKPFGENITAIFDVFLRRNLPISNEYTIALLPDGFYASSSSTLPESIERNSSIIEHWQGLTEPERGKVDSSQEQIVYLAEPIKINSKVKGVFVIAIATNSELQEINAAIMIVIRVTAATIVITSGLAWIFAGQILTPLRLLTKTVRTISENNLDKRLPVRGNDEVAQLSRTFNEMLDRLQSAFVTQREFLNDIGHELKTPITIIRGHLEVMGNTPEDHRETKKIALDELQRMNRLISDLMLLAKSEQPDFLYLEVVDICSLTEEIYGKVTAIADRNWQLDTVATGKIVVDCQRLIQAITNLAQNATKYTEPEDIIAIGSAINNNYLYLWVRDTGQGIPEVDKDRIFKRFQTGTHNCGHSTTGLGLSIVTAIAQAHGGKVRLSSSVDRGSEFTLVLPLTK
jgi:signal transduction histidine kinase